MKVHVVLFICLLFATNAAAKTTAVASTTSTSTVSTTTTTTTTTTAGSPTQGSSKPEYSKELETELRKALFTDYESMQRPEKRVAVEIALNLMSIGYLDIKEQTLSISGYLSMEWGDSRLAWDNNDTYANIKFLFSNEDTLWRPAIILENSVQDIDVISKPQVLMRIISNGRVSWTPAGIYVTYCESDVTYYPLDTQYCDIILSTWSYTAGEVALQFFNDTDIKTDFYQENGEWEILGISSQASTSKRESESFSRLRFTLSLRRRPLFHILNTIFPVIMMAFLTVFVFKLPVESGERIGLSLTILLAYAVYLTLISANIPQTSLSASILSTYLAVILVISTFSVIVTIFIVDIYFRSENEKVPDWLQMLTKRVLVRVVCWKRHHSKDEKRREDSDNIRRFRVSPVPDSAQEVTRKSQSFRQKTADKLKIKELDADGTAFMRGGKSQTHAWRDDKDESFPERTLEEAEPDYSWKEIAMVLDKCFLYIFLLMVTTVTAVCMGLITGHFYA